MNIPPSAGVPAPLTSFAIGRRVQLEFMALEAEEARRLRDLGLREGASLSILQNTDKLICHVGGCRLGLRRELGRCLFCREVSSP